MKKIISDYKKYTVYNNAFPTKIGLIKKKKRKKGSSLSSC